MTMFRRKDTQRLLWLMEHCYHPTFTNRDGKGWSFGIMVKRKTMRQAIDDAMAESDPNKGGCSKYGALRD